MAMEYLTSDETWVFTATYTITAKDFSPLVNTATVSGTDVLSQSVESEEDTASVYILRPAIAIDKTAEPEQAHEGDTITYTYTVTNPGNVPLSNVSVTDDKIEDVTYQSGDTNGNSRLDTGETWTFTADYTVSAEDDSPLVNTATASGTDALSQSVESEEDTASVYILRPAIAIDKTAEPEQAYVEENITYTYTVTNPGNVPLSNVSVTDSNIEVVTYQSGDTNGNSKLDTSETWIFTATYTVGVEDPNPLVNTATASGTDALGLPVTYEATASVTITVTETASISVEVESGPEAPIFIWDNTTGDWAIDQSTGQPVDGSNHATPGIIAVAGGHSYCVWVENGYFYQLSTYPEGWEVSYYPVFGHEVEAACGLAEAGYLYSVTFFVTASIQVQITGQEPPTASIFIWDDTLGEWAVDQYTGWAVNGTNHSTPSIIEVAGGHYYYVWVDAGEGGYCYPSELPDGWYISYYPPPEGEIPAAYGYAAADILYSLNFTVPY